MSRDNLAEPAASFPRSSLLVAGVILSNALDFILLDFPLPARPDLDLPFFASTILPFSGGDLLADPPPSEDGVLVLRDMEKLRTLCTGIRFSTAS